LYDEEVVTTNGGDKEGSGAGGLAFVGEVFDKVEEFTRFVADGFEKGEVVSGVVAVEVFVAAFVEVKAAVEEGEEGFVPSHGLENRKLRAKNQGFSRESWWSLFF